jgi:hypothetical protein
MIPVRGKLYPKRIRFVLGTTGFFQSSFALLQLPLSIYRLMKRIRNFSDFFLSFCPICCCDNSADVTLGERILGIGYYYSCHLMLYTGLYLRIYVIFFTIIISSKIKESKKCLQASQPRNHVENNYLISTRSLVRFMLTANFILNR